MRKSRPAKVHTGNQQVFADGLGEDRFPRRSGLRGIAIKSNGGGGSCDLNMRKMDDVAPNQQALRRGVDAKPNMAWRVPG